MEFQKLTIVNYSENPEEERRITFNPGLITLIAAEVEDVTVKGRSLRHVSVLFTDGGSVDVLVNHSDLEKMETAIGTFCLG